MVFHRDYHDLQGQHFTVVGAAGFVGQRLCATLRARGAQVWAPARHEAWPWQPPPGHVLGHVMYCAGLTADYLARPFDTVQAHVSHLAQVLQHGLAQGTLQSLVYLSSTRLYDGLGDLGDQGAAHEDAVLPMDPANPRHLYDLSKGLGESLCHVAGQGRARVARLACVYEGPQDADGFLPALLRQVLQARASGARQISVQSSPHFTRDYVHLDDVVDALIRIAQRVDRHAELLTVLAQLLDLGAGRRIRNGKINVEGRGVVILGGEGLIGVADRAAGQTKSFEGLRAGNLV